MKKDTSYSFQSKKGMEVTFEELHIRHINLLIDIKNKELNNWFLKMAIINTFDDLKIFLNNLKKNKNKCIIAIYGNEIIGYLNIFPLNKKETCLKISKPKLINSKCSLTDKQLTLGLIKKSISIKEIKTSSWIINSDINNVDLISNSRELGFQPFGEIILWDSIEELISYSFNMEADLTSSLQQLYSISERISDTRTNVFLDPIIEAQTQSEDEFANILGKVKFASNQPSAILLIDSDLKKK